MKVLSFLTFHTILKVGLVFLLSLLLIACGDPVQLSMEGEYEQELDSAVTVDKLRAPKYQRKRVPLVRRPISDVVQAEIKSAKPPPPKPPSSPPTPVAETSPAPTYDQDLAEETTKPIGAKIRRVLTTSIRRPSTSGKVDIVFVIDASYSMEHFLRSKRIKQVFGGFIQALQPLNWQMMFTNADYGDRWFLTNLGARDGKAMRLESNGRTLSTKVLTKHNPQADSIFIDTLRQHEFMEYTRPAGDSDNEISQCHLAPGCHSMTSNEQPLKATQASFVSNRSLFRSNADVAVVIFSDSDEGEKHKDQSKRTKADEVLKTFEEQWGVENKRLVAYGIIMIPGEDSECVKKYSSGFYAGEGLFGTELARMAELTGGENYSLCDESYVPLAKQIVVDFQE